MTHVTMQARSRRLGGVADRALTVRWALLVTVALGLGCAGDDPGVLGSGLPIDLSFDTLLVPLASSTLDAAGHLAVKDPNVPFDKHEVLYVGRRGTERSALLARYDLSVFTGPVWEGVAFTVDNIRSVRLRFFMLKYYKSLRLTKNYEVWELASSLDPTIYPAEEPLLQPPMLAVEEEPASAAIRIDLPKQKFIDWWQAGQHNGLLVREGAAIGDTNAGFVGFASRDFKVVHAGELELEQAETVLGPLLIVEFASPDTVVVLQPIDDVSTMRPLDPPPAVADGLLLRTHERTYPYCAFSLSGLPPDVLINRATLVLTCDSLLSYGPSTSVVCSEILAGEIAALGDTALVGNLGAAAEVITGILSVEPARARRLGFNVTSTVQRHVNGLFPVDDPVRFLFTAGEDFTGAYDTSDIDPDFFLSRLRFWGAAADDTLRPRLQIIYTPAPGLAGRSR